MIRLGIETATDFCSVGLQVGERTTVREEHAPRGHAMLLPWIRDLMSDAGIGFSDLDSVAVSRGPGGFTSLRIGMAVAQGIALAHDLPVHMVSTLEVLAHAADPARREQRILAVLDARMNEVYAGWFEAAEGRHVPLAGEAVLAPDRLVAPVGGSWLVVGPGLAEYGEQVGDALAGQIAGCQPDIWPGAEAVLALAQNSAGVPAWDVAPVYVRDQVTG